MSLNHWINLHLFVVQIKPLNHNNISWIDQLVDITTQILNLVWSKFVLVWYSVFCGTILYHFKYVVRQVLVPWKIQAVHIWFNGTTYIEWVRFNYSTYFFKWGGSPKSNIPFPFPLNFFRTTYSIRTWNEFINKIYFLEHIFNINISKKKHIVRWRFLK